MDIEKLRGIRADYLENLIGDALPANGEWHTLTSYVRKTEGGELQVDELLVRRIVQNETPVDAGMLVSGPDSAAEVDSKNASKPAPDNG